MGDLAVTMRISRNFSNVAELTASLEAQSHAYRQQWANWLGVGSAGGLLALLSFAANLPDPDYALSILKPGLAAFTLGLVAAAPGLLLSAMEASAAGSHHAHAANREQVADALNRLPQIVSSPQRIADDLNAPRTKLAAEYERLDHSAEAAWTARTRWRWAANITAAISALSFTCGVAFPLAAVLSGTKFVPQIS